MSNERRTVIYYFSGTGNNRFISKRLAERLGDAEIFPIKVLEAEPKIPKEYKTVIFCWQSERSKRLQRISYIRKGSYYIKMECFIRRKKNQDYKPPLRNIRRLAGSLRYQTIVSDVEAA